MRSSKGTTSFLLFRPPFGAQNKEYQQVVNNQLIANWPYKAYVQDVEYWTRENLTRYKGLEGHDRSANSHTGGIPVLRIYKGLLAWNDEVITTIYPELEAAVRVFGEQDQTNFDNRDRVIKAIQSGKLQPWDLSMLEMLRGGRANHSIAFVPFWLITCPNCQNKGIDIVYWLNRLKGEAFGALQPGTLRMVGAIYKEYLRTVRLGRPYNPN